MRTMLNCLSSLGYVGDLNPGGFALGTSLQSRLSMSEVMKLLFVTSNFFPYGWKHHDFL